MRGRHVGVGRGRVPSAPANAANAVVDAALAMQMIRLPFAHLALMLPLKPLALPVALAAGGAVALVLVLRRRVFTVASCSSFDSV